MFFEFLESIRNKSEEFRRKLLFFLTGFIMLIITSFWLSGVNNHFSIMQDVDSVENIKNNNTVDSPTSPFSLLKKSVTDFGGGLANFFSSIGGGVKIYNRGR